MAQYNDSWKFLEINMRLLNLIDLYRSKTVSILINKLSIPINT